MGMVDSMTLPESVQKTYDYLIRNGYLEIREETSEYHAWYTLYIVTDYAHNIHFTRGGRHYMVGEGQPEQERADEILGMCRWYWTRLGERMMG